MRTTLTLDEDVASTVRNEMKAGNGKSFKDAVNDLIRYGRYFQQSREIVKDRKPFKVRAFDMGLHENLNYDNIAELLDEIEGPPHK